MTEEDRRFYLLMLGLVTGLVVGGELGRAKERRRAAQALDRAKTTIQFGL